MRGHQGDDEGASGDDKRGVATAECWASPKMPAGSHIWVPTFAGMTKRAAGMTKGTAGMTKKAAGMTMWVAGDGEDICDDAR